MSQVADMQAGSEGVPRLANRRRAASDGSRTAGALRTPVQGLQEGKGVPHVAGQRSRAHGCKVCSFMPTLHAEKRD